MSERFKIDLKRIAIMLLMYPLIVVFFKMFLIPLESKVSILLIIMTISILNLNLANRCINFLLPVTLYIHLRSIYIVKISNLPMYYSRYNNYYENLVRGVKRSVSITDVKIFMEEEIIISALYLLCIVIIIVLYKILSVLVSGKYFNVFHIVAFAFFVMAWFSYIDVRLQIMIYLLGVLILNSKHQKIHHLIIVLMIIFLLLNFLNKIIPYEKINESLSLVAPDILILRSDYSNRESFFSFENTMYNPNNSVLGGSVSPDSNHLIMSVITGEDILYLRGSVKDVYSGLSWEKKDYNYKKFQSSKSYSQKKFHMDNLKSVFITYEGIRSLTIFSPIGVLEYSLDESKLRVDNDSNVYYKNGIFEDSISEYKIVFTGEDLEIIDKYKYLTLSDTITDRTIKLANDITLGIDNDRDKILAIKQYLISNYPYALELDDNAKYSDFVDHFLFEEKKGYCSYYASSLAILARINEIPSRYVEGYIVSPESYRDGKYLITEDKAHAWTEVYIDDTGWLIIDPTPIYDYDDEKIESIRLEKESIVIIEESKKNEITNSKKSDAILADNSKRNEANKYVYIFIAIFIFVFCAFILARIRRLKVTNKDKAIRFIYIIDLLLDEKLKIENLSSQTVYYKMHLYNQSFDYIEENQGQSTEQKNAIIKDVKEILYNRKIVSDNDLINLEKYLKNIRKNGFL